MNAVVENVIAKVLSPYLEGVSRENLRLGLMSGNLNLKNLRVKSSLLSDQLHLHQASFEQASVNSVSISIPWTNPLTGKIVIEVSGVLAKIRLAQSKEYEREELLQIRREAIDAIKKSIRPSGNDLLVPGLNNDTYTAKLLRRLIDSIIVTIEGVEISVVIPWDEPLGGTDVDAEGFQDPMEFSELTLKVDRISIEDMPGEKDTVAKSFKVSGVRISDIVPRFDCEIQATHDMVKNSLNFGISGLHYCDISFGQEHLVAIKRLIEVVKTNPVEGESLTYEARARYKHLYARFLEGLTEDQIHLENMMLSFDPNALAQIENLVDRERASEAEGEQAASWWSFWWSKEDTQQLREVSHPTRFDVRIEIGKEWNICIGSFLNVELNGALLTGEITTDPTCTNVKIYFASRGLSLFHRQDPLVEFKRRGLASSSSLSLDSSPRMAGENPLEVSIDWSSDGEIFLDWKSEPLRLTYEPGLVREISDFISVFRANPEAIRAQILSGQELFQRLQSSEEYRKITEAIQPKKIGFKLDIAAPLVVLPAGAGNQVIISFGHLVAHQPKTESDSLFRALIEKISISVKSRNHEYRVLSPAPVDISGRLADEMLHLGLSIDETLACRVSPEVVSIFLDSVKILQQEAEYFSQTTSELFQEETDSLVNYPFMSGSETPPRSVISVLLQCSFKRIDLMVSDGASDMVNFQVAIPDVSLGTSSEELSVSIETLRLTSRVMNLSIGDWEPLIEPTTYSMFLHQQAGKVSVGLKSTGTNFVVNPNSIGVLFQLMQLDWIRENRALSTRSQYRLINATDQTIYCGFKNSKRWLIELVPSDNFCIIDDKVMQYGAREICVSLSKSTLFSDDEVMCVPLDRLFSGRLDGKILVHSRNPLTGAAGTVLQSSFHTVLISYDTFILNQCDVPIELNKLGKAVARYPTPSCELLGAVAFRGEVFETSKDEDFLILNPGRFISIPSESLQAGVEIRPVLGGSRPWISLPSPEAQTCADVDCLGSFHVRVEKSQSEMIKIPLASKITQINIRPPLVVVNNLPSPIRFRYQNLEDRLVFVDISAWDCVAVYSCRASEQIEHMAASIGFTEEGTEWSRPIGSGSDRHEISPDIRSIHPVHLTSTVRHGREITVSGKWWLVNRTGISSIQVFHSDSDKELPRIDNVFLLPDPDRATSVEITRGRDRWEEPILDGGWTPGFLGKLALVLNSKETLQDKFVEIVPRFTFFNGLESESVFVASKFTGAGTSNSSFDLIEPGSGIPLLHCHDYFSFQLADGSASCEIPLKESSAGVWPILLGKDRVCRVEISPLEGCIHVAVRECSSVIVRNKKRSKTVYISVDEGKVFSVPPRTGREIGWADPFKNATTSTTMRVTPEGTPFVVPLARASDGVVYGGCVEVLASSEPQSIEIIVESGSRESRTEALAQLMSLEVEIDKVGFSLCRDGKELIYAELSIIRAICRQRPDCLRVAALVSDIQIETSVSMHNERPVVVTNTGEGSRPFSEAIVEISTNVSRGISAVSLADIQFDSLFVEIDSELAQALDDCLKELIETEEDARSSMANAQHAKKLLTEDLYPVIRGRVQPIPPPNLLILDSLFVSKLSIELWVDFALKSMVFMPASLKLIVSMLSLGRSFKLDGANVLIRPRAVDSFKGSADQFFQSLLRDYTVEALRNAATLLGNSSLLAIPRAPISFVSGVGAKGLEQAAGAVSGLVNLLSDLTADSKYREKQQQIRRTKQIAGFADGFVEGANRIGEGLGGMLDIFKKPVQEAKKGGFMGFMKGLGTGFVGSVVKPVAKLGEAIGDVGTGIARTFQPKNKRDRSIYLRKRIPRAFYGQSHVVSEYRVIDAVIAAVAPEMFQDMEIVIPLKDSRALVGFIDRMILISLRVQRQLSLASIPDSEPGVLSTPGSETPTETLSTAPPPETSFEEAPITGLRIDSVVSILLKDIAAASNELSSVEIHLKDKSCYELQVDLANAEVVDNLVACIADTISEGCRSGHCDWREAKRGLTELAFVECLLSRPRAGPSAEYSDDSKVVEVWEVERFLMAYGWVTPFMLLDTETSWRWLDSHQNKHARIDGRLSRNEAANAKTPPLSFGELWKPVTEWEVEIDEGRTDANGWMYAISFNSSTWQNSPGIAASVRKRKWTRILA